MTTKFFWRIASVVLVMSIVLSFALVSVAATTDGNLIDTIPSAVDINSGEVGCAVSGNIVTLAANSTVGTSSDWGMQGFHINKAFISTLQDGWAPVFPEETKVLISAKVRKAQDATADAKINVSYSSWYKVQYESGTHQYTDTYPTVGDGFLVDSTEWTDFKAVITVPASTDGNTWAYTLGLASGTAQGAKVEVDMTSMYFGKQKEITIPDDLSDYTPTAVDSNIIDTHPTEGNLDINDGAVSTAASGDIATIGANSTTAGNADHALQGFVINNKFISNLSADKTEIAFAQGTKVLFSAKVRKAQDATANAKINVAYSIPGSGNSGAWHYPDNYADGFEVTSTEWTELKAVITPRENIGGASYWQVLFGFHGGTEAGAKVEIDMTSMYLGAEIPYDIEVTADGTTAEAKIVNQIGEKFSGVQGGFIWKAMNADRTAEVEGIEILDNGDGTAAISVADSVAAGKYDIVAISDTYEGFVKGTSITVTNLKYDYAPADDGNLIDTHPVSDYLDINDGGVSATASGDVATLSATSTSSGNADHALQGFVINNKFISNLSTDKKEIAFTQGTKILFSAKVRKAQDATADAKINVAYSIPGSGNSGAWHYSDNSFDVISTEWTDFNAVITARENIGGASYWEVLFGFQGGTEAGAKVEIDMTSMYLGAEIPYDIEVTADGTTAEAKIVNQIGEKFSGAQGGFSWIAMNADRTAEVEGIEVLDNGDGTANVSVADSVAAGTYNIVAVSDTYEGFVKGASITVANLKNDYTPAADGNIIDTHPVSDYLDINDGGVSATASGDVATLSATSTSSGNADHALQGFVINNKFISNLSTDKKEIAFTQGTKILFSAKVRKAQDATADAKINVAYSIPGSGNSGAWHYSDNSFDVISTEWTDFNAVITARENIGGASYWEVLFGFQGGTEAGAKVEIDMSSMYFGAEEIYDITNKAVGSSAVEAGVDSTVTYKAQIVNQIGITSDIPQGTFDWFVMNEDKTAAVSGIEVIANADNTATINVSKDVPAGTYMVIAKSNLYSDYIKSSPLVVTEGGVVHTIYVSPEGNDSNIGTLASPLKTVQAAQALARQYVAEGKLPLEVVFRGGDYYFAESLAFGANDSGVDGRNVTYRAYENEEVKFKGSKQIDLSQAAKVTDSDILARIRDEVKSDVRVIDLAAQGITAEQICTPAGTPTIYKLDFNREFNGFYINGEGMDIASWPNGHVEATYKFDDTDNVNKFTYTSNEPDRWGNARNWWVSIFNSYDYAPLRLKASSIDTTNNVIYVGDNTSMANINNPYTPRWKAYNLLEEIDIAGEYYIDIENMKLYFLPGCDLEGATAEFEVIGDPVITLKDAKNITFKDIEFSQINDDGVVMTDVDNVDVLGCTFRDIGFRGLAVLGTEEPKTVQYATGDKFPYGDAAGEVSTANNASYNVDIKDNVFYNTGSSAIHINGGNIDTLTPSNNVVENNFISKFAQNSYWDGVVVAGVGTKVRKNNISDSPYHAIRIYGNDHVIEYNEIYDVIKNSNDAAAIYVGASAIARGSVIQYNYIHDIKTWKDTKNDWEVGIYLDDCQQGITVINNIIADVDEGIWSNGAGDYTIDANTIVNATTGIRFGYNEDADPSESVRADVANRIYNKDIYYAKYPALKDYVDGVSPKKSSKANANIFCNVATNMEYYRESWFTGNINTCTKSLSQDKDAQHAGNNTVTADVFVNPAAQDYRVNSDNVSSYYYSTNVENTPDINVIGMSTNLVLNAETSPFTATNPVNGATKVPTNGVWLAWNDAFGATQYRVQVATDAALNNTVYNAVVPCAAANISDSVALSADATYYWKVTAINPSRDFGAEWSIDGSFTTAGTSIENMTLDGDTVTADIYTYGDVISGSVDGVCYIASYNENGKLIELVPQEITLEAGKIYPFENAFENFVEEEVYSVKMYVWTEGFVPVTDMISISIPKEEQ